MSKDKAAQKRKKKALRLEADRLVKTLMQDVRRGFTIATIPPDVMDQATRMLPEMQRVLAETGDDFILRNEVDVMAYAVHRLYPLVMDEPDIPLAEPVADEPVAVH